mmetsp:Transcript_61584/g.163814  ORF Transcript_61584/g.163814 Transcript_61584/m.163814 type:complete len:283 (+) Transcript_61584:2991-3839(+)
MGTTSGESRFRKTRSAKHRAASCRTMLSESSTAGRYSEESVPKNFCPTSGQLNCTAGRSSARCKSPMASFLQKLLLLAAWGRTSSTKTSNGRDHSNCSTLSMRQFGFHTLLSLIRDNRTGKICLAGRSKSRLSPFAMRPTHLAASVSTGMLLSPLSNRINGCTKGRYPSSSVNRGSSTALANTCKYCLFSAHFSKEVTLLIHQPLGNFLRPSTAETMSKRSIFVGATTSSTFSPRYKRFTFLTRSSSESCSRRFASSFFCGSSIGVMASEMSIQQDNSTSTL